MGSLLFDSFLALKTTFMGKFHFCNDLKTTFMGKGHLFLLKDYVYGKNFTFSFEKTTKY